MAIRMCVHWNWNCFRSALLGIQWSVWLIRIICKRSVDLCGSCELIRNCLLYWYGQFIIYIVSIILYILYNIPRNICLEILINLRIYLVFMRISNCILWNPWISVVNLQYSALNLSKLSFYNSFLTSPPSVPLSDQGCERSVTSKFTSLDLF